MAVVRDEPEQLARALGAPEAVLQLAVLEMRQGGGKEGLGDEGVLRGVCVGLGEVVQGADGHAGVLLKDAAESSEEADA